MLLRDEAGHAHGAPEAADHGGRRDEVEPVGVGPVQRLGEARLLVEHQRQPACAQRRLGQQQPRTRGGQGDVQLVVGGEPLHEQVVEPEQQRAQRLAGLALRDRRDEPVQAVLRLQEERLPVTW